MPDLAKRLCGPVAMATSAVTVYTVPASTTTIIRSIHVNNTSSSSTGLTFTLSIGANAAATQLFTTYILAPFATLDWSGFIVLTAGEIVQALASNTAMTLTMSGVEST